MSADPMRDEPRAVEGEGANDRFHSTTSSGGLVRFATFADSDYRLNPPIEFLYG